MADTSFTNGVTLTDADWFNDVNRLHYTILGDPADAAAVRTSLALVPGTDVLAYVAPGTSGNVLTSNGSAWTSSPVAASTSVPVRQTVLSGPVDSSGYSAFGGSTGSTTVTASGTLKATAAAGGDANYTGSITNPSWTGLSTNGTMYLYLDITSGGVVTTGSTTLAPAYQWGGTYSVTNLQNTFNIQEMTMKVGNGSTAAQVYRVFVGEVTVAGGVVTAIVWYALMGRYVSALTALPAAGTPQTHSHNIGVPGTFLTVVPVGQCTSATAGFSTGDQMMDLFTVATVGGAYASSILSTITRLSATVLGDAYGFVVKNKTTGVAANITGSNFSVYVSVSRRF